MQLLPGLPNFVKSNQVVKLEPCKFDIYKLKKIEKKNLHGDRTVQLVFSYKIKKTYYYIYSAKADFFAARNGKTTKPAYGDGFVVLRKGFKKYRLELKELNADLSNSIGRNMDRFNTFVRNYNQSLVDNDKKSKEAKALSKQEKINNFIKELDF